MANNRHRRVAKLEKQLNQHEDFKRTVKYLRKMGKMTDEISKFNKAIRIAMERSVNSIKESTRNIKFKK